MTTTMVRLTGTKYKMEIYALEGHKVRFVGENGSESSIESAKTFLKIGEIYTVDHTEVGQSYTAVHLKEVPPNSKGYPMSFNSVMFEDVEPQSEADTRRHPNYYFYHEPAI